MEEFLDVLAVGIEDDRDFAPGFDLTDDLPDERRFTGAGVARDLDVMRFAITADDKIFAGFAGLEPLEKIARILYSEAQAIALHLPVETPAADQAWASQAATVARFGIMAAIETRARRNQQQESNSEARSGQRRTPASVRPP